MFLSPRLEAVRGGAQSICQLSFDLPTPVRNVCFRSEKRPQLLYPVRLDSGPFATVSSCFHCSPMILKFRPFPGELNLHCVVVGDRTVNREERSGRWEGRIIVLAKPHRFSKLQSAFLINNQLRVAHLAFRLL